MIKLLSETELAAYVDILALAYPGSDRLGSEARREDLESLRRTQREDPTIGAYGYFRDGKLLGGMRIHRFRMQMHTVRVAAGGVGLVAVDLLHKREHVGRELMRFFLHHCRQEGMPLALLYPFRPDFYRRMGFGYGTKMSQYRVRPASFPQATAKEHLAWLGREDRDAVAACYERMMGRTHGLLEKSPREWDRLLAGTRFQVVGYREDGQIRGYLVFRFQKRANWLLNDMEVVEFFYETDRARAELMAFLHSQADQINRVVVNLQDEFFHHLAEDPRDDSDHLIPSVYHQTNTQGVGIMYRVVDMPALLEALKGHRFGIDCRLRITIRDSFLPENEGSSAYRFWSGGVEPLSAGPVDAEIRLDVADFSSVVMGVVPLEQLVRYGRAEITEPEQLERVTALFWTGRQPICVTPF